MWERGGPGTGRNHYRWLSLKMVTSAGAPNEAQIFMGNGVHVPQQ